MIEPVALAHFSQFFVTAALVVVAGFSYAALYACARFYRRRALLGWAAVAYGVLVGAVLVLAALAHLEGFWQILSGLLLVGYGAAPVLIWRLWVAIHQD